MGGRTHWMRWFSAAIAAMLLVGVTMLFLRLWAAVRQTASVPKVAMAGTHRLGQHSINLAARDASDGGRMSRAGRKLRTAMPIR